MGLAAAAPVARLVGRKGRESQLLAALLHNLPHKRRYIPKFVE